MTTPIQLAPTHVPMDQFAVVNGELVIGGQPISSLAAHVGSTPFYAYDSALIRKRVSELRKVLPDFMDLHYAMKANPMPEVVAMMVGLVDGVDVASGGELQAALDAGADAAHVSFAGPGKRTAELQLAVQSGIRTNVESMRDVRALAAVSRDLGLPARVAVRVNPDFELKSSGMKMGGGATPFGIDEEQVPAVLEEIGLLGLNFEGFHVYAGSQNLRAGAIVDAQNRTLELAVRLGKYAPSAVQSLNLGGGFGVPYFPGEQHLDLATIGEHWAGLAERARRELPGARLAVELGRYLVAEAGVYVARVLDRKVSRERVFLVVDGGMHHHLAASGNFGQVIRKNYPVAIGNKMGFADAEVCSVVGPLCTPLDILADRVVLPVASEGDLVVVFQSGAYGASASPKAFLSHPHCAEILV